MPIDARSDSCSISRKICLHDRKAHVVLIGDVWKETARRDVCIDSEPNLQQCFQNETFCARDAGATAGEPQ